MWSRSSCLWKPRGRDSLNLYPNILYLEPIQFPLYISSRQQFPADKLRITRSSLYTRALTIWIPRNRSFMPGEDDFYTRGASLRRVSRIRATTSFFSFFFFFFFLFSPRNTEATRRETKEIGKEDEAQEEEGGKGRRNIKKTGDGGKKRKSLGHYHLTRIAKNSFVTRDSTWPSNER